MHTGGWDDVAMSYVGHATMLHMGHTGPFKVPGGGEGFLPEGLSAHVWPWNLEVPGTLVAKIITISISSIFSSSNSKC